MILQSLEVRNFRNLEKQIIRFQEGLNWLVGSNGEGKTNTLEAVYFVLTTKSFRTAKLQDLSASHEKEASVVAEFKRNQATFRFRVEIEEGKSKRFLGDKSCSPIDFFEAAAVIAFTARSKALVEGSPEDRRKFLDRIVTYLEPDYIHLLGRYRKFQRNLSKILYQDKDLGVYRGFKITAAKTARQIVEKRLQYLELLKPGALSLFKELFFGEKDLYFNYKIKGSKTLEEYEQRFVDLAAQEMLHGKSMIGPHLDDLEIAFEGEKAKVFASSGQIRAVVLSMKMAVRELYKERFGCRPILLLDDIDAELDPERLERLLTFLEAKGQSLITTSKCDTIQRRSESHHDQQQVLRVHAGRISSERNGG